MVSVDDLETNNRFAAQENANFPMLSDEGGKVADTYGVLPPINPDKAGAVRRARRWMFFIGPDGKIQHIETVGHTADAGEFLAAKLAELKVKTR